STSPCAESLRIMLTGAEPLDWSDSSISQLSIPTSSYTVQKVFAVHLLEFIDLPLLPLACQDECRYLPFCTRRHSCELNPGLIHPVMDTAYPYYTSAYGYSTPILPLMREYHRY